MVVLSMWILLGILFSFTYLFFQRYLEYEPITLEDIVAVTLMSVVFMPAAALVALFSIIEFILKKIKSFSNKRNKVVFQREIK